MNSFWNLLVHIRGKQWCPHLHFHTSIDFVGIFFYFVLFSFCTNSLLNLRLRRKGKKAPVFKKVEDCCTHNVLLERYIWSYNSIRFQKYFWVCTLFFPFFCSCMCESEFLGNENHRMCQFLSTRWVFLLKLTYGHWSSLHVYAIRFQEFVTHFLPSGIKCFH
jgi:hypothetical protein